MHTHIHTPIQTYKVIQRNTDGNTIIHKSKHTHTKTYKNKHINTNTSKK